MVNTVEQVYNFNQKLLEIWKKKLWTFKTWFNFMFSIGQLFFLSNNEPEDTLTISLNSSKTDSHEVLG